MKEMVTSLQTKHVSLDLAKKFASSLGLLGDDLREGVSTTLGDIAQIWIKKNETCTPMELVEALVCTQDLGRYASGITGMVTNNYSQKYYIV